MGVILVIAAHSGLTARRHPRGQVSLKVEAQPADLMARGPMNSSPQAHKVLDPLVPVNECLTVLGSFGLSVLGILGRLGRHRLTGLTYSGNSYNP